MEMQPDLLNDIQQEIYHEPASIGIRFANYIIDLVIFYILSIVVGLLLANSLPSAGIGISYVITYLLFIIYYTLMEGATQGKTVGKLVTGTIAIRNDGAPFTFYDAMVRSFCRIVPFEPLSAFGGNPWHDKWTNTKVIKPGR